MAREGGCAAQRVGDANLLEKHGDESDNYNLKLEKNERIVSVKVGMCENREHTTSLQFLTFKKKEL